MIHESEVELILWSVSCDFCNSVELSRKEHSLSNHLFQCFKLSWNLNYVILEDIFSLSMDISREALKLRLQILVYTSLKGP